MTTFTEVASTLLRSPKASAGTAASPADSFINPAGLCIVHRGRPEAIAKSLSLFTRSRGMGQGSGDGVRSRGPHPGDVLYWIGCVGAVGLLLLVAIR